MTLNLPKTVRSIRRVQIIARILTHHGFGHLVDRLRLDRFVPLPKRWRHTITPPEGPEIDTNVGRRLAHTFKDLGPTFIKLGQMMSTRPDLFPADIIKELILLQDQVPPFDTSDAKRIIAATLGAPVEQCFATFEDTPFASGSIAQVHRATTRATDTQAGERVVVKIKRPDIEDIVRLDMTILRWIADMSERLIPELHLYRPTLIVEEFERKMMREMDFVNEAATISSFAEAFNNDPNFRIPKVYWELTGTGVLTLEELRGISAQTLINHPDSRFDNKAIGTRLAQAFVKQFFEIGLFHADPHPGNLLIEPPARIALIDFGLTGRIDEEMLSQLVIALTAAFNREPDIIVEVLADMDALGDNTDRHQLRNDFLHLIEKYYGLPLYRFDPQILFYEISGLIRRHDVSLPREFIMFGKALVAVGGVCLQLTPDLDLLTLVQPKLKALLVKRMMPSRLMKSAAISGWHLLHILKAAPSLLRDISRRLARGRWQVNIRHQNLDLLAQELDRSSNRLAFAVIIAAIIVGSSLVIGSQSKATFLGIPLPALGLGGYLVAGMMGLGLLVAMLRSGKLS